MVKLTEYPDNNACVIAHILSINRQELEPHTHYNVLANSY